MTNITIWIFCLILFISCHEDLESNKLRLIEITLQQLEDPNELTKWDSLDGPDIFITISINDSIVFISDKMEHQNVASVPINFKLNSNIVFQQSKDEILINAYDIDELEDQLMEYNLNLTPGFVMKSPHIETISCSKCVAWWKMKYEVVN